MATNEDGSGMSRRKVSRQFLSIPFSTKDQPDGLGVVHEAARSLGMKTTTYVRQAAMRCARDDIAAARASRRRRAG